MPSRRTQPYRSLRYLVSHALHVPGLGSSCPNACVQCNRRQCVCPMQQPTIFLLIIAALGRRWVYASHASVSCTTATSVASSDDRLRPAPRYHPMDVREGQNILQTHLWPRPLVGGFSLPPALGHKKSDGDCPINYVTCICLHRSKTARNGGVLRRQLA